MTRFRRGRSELLLLALLAASAPPGTDSSFLHPSPSLPSAARELREKSHRRAEATTPPPPPPRLAPEERSEPEEAAVVVDALSRRECLEGFLLASSSSASLVVSSVPPFSTPPPAVAAESSQSSSSSPPKEDFYAPKFVQKYEDFVQTDEGWQYKDVKVGSGIAIEDGDRVVFDWSGYTIGYFGRPFEAKGGPRGGAFDKELDYFRTVVGSGTIVGGLECALRSMKPGGVRQVVIPYGPLSYPDDDMEHVKVGPKPTTFSGQRALNFVLQNPRVDRTLLFNVKVVRVDKKDGKGGFVRG